VLTSGEIVAMIDMISQKRLDVKHAFIAHLPLEIAVLRILERGAAHSTQPAMSARPQATPPAQKKTLDEAVVQQTAEAQDKPPVRVIESAVSAHQSQPETSPHVTADVSGEAVISLDAIKRKWNELLVTLQRDNPSLVLILKTAEPLRVQGNVMTIGYKYPFHKDRVMTGDSYDTLCSICSTVYGVHLALQGEVLPSDYVSEFIAEVTSDDEVEFVADTVVATNTTSIIQDATPPQTTLNDAPRAEEPEPQADALIHNLVQAFGGRIVE